MPPQFRGSTFVCQQCGKQFRLSPSRVAEGRGAYCSRACYTAHRRAAEIGDLFWAKVDKSGGADACWPWTGTCYPNGYGEFIRLGKHYLTHRLAYKLTHGSIPEGKLICHTCDNPPCCNPTHLFPGSQAENLEDMMAKGRHWMPRGEQMPNARLTEDDVREIRRRHTAGGITQAALAIEYGVKPNTINQIVGRKRWPHVT